MYNGYKKKLYPEEGFIFVQDGASSHTSRMCQNFLHENLVKGRFVPGNAWPPYSADLNLDYYFWDWLKNKVYEGRREAFHDIDELQSCIRRKWKRVIDISEVRAAIQQFLRRCRTFVEMEGGPIKEYYG